MAANLINELVYISYSHNRRLSPHMTPRQWAIVYGLDAVNNMEQRFQEEGGLNATVTATFGVDYRVVDEELAEGVVA